ncbi:MAG: hypothetical protein NXI21_01295 [Alphaproteobacteria bacterium]|nr:hypothetical protein [Alphaproteobacteria bacterium]
MMFRRVLSVFAFALLLIGCVTTPPPPPLIEQPRHISYGPFEPAEFSLFQPNIDLWPEAEAPLWIASEGLRSRYVSTDNENAGMQVTFLRSGDNFVFRLMMRLPEARLQRLASGNDFYGVGLTLEAENGDYAWVTLGYVNTATMERMETPEGWVLDSGWIWSPGLKDSLVDHLNSEDGKQRRIFYAAWRHLKQYMRQDRAVFLGLHRQGQLCTSGCETRIRLDWIDPSWEMDTRLGVDPIGWSAPIHEIIAQQRIGDDAKIALKQGDEIYAQDFADVETMREARTQVIEWMKTEVRPVSPHGFLEGRCGRAPKTSSDDIDKLGGYLSCVERARGDFDHAAYTAIYDEARSVTDAWELIRGRYWSHESIPADRFIIGFPIVHPEDVEVAFDMTYSYFAGNLANAKESAENARIASEARQQRRREALASMPQSSDYNILQNFMASQLAQNQQILNQLEQSHNQAQSTYVQSQTTQTPSTGSSTESASAAPPPQTASLPPTMNETYWVAFAGGSGDPAGGCARMISAISIGDTSRIICKFAGTGTLAKVHRYYCDAPADQPRVEAYSAQGPNAVPILTYYLRGLTKAQSERLIRAYRDGNAMRSGRHVDTTEIMTYRGIEDTWLRATDADGRQLFFRSDAELRGGVIRYCGGGGLAAWETGADRRIEQY